MKKLASIFAAAMLLVASAHAIDEAGLTAALNSPDRPEEDKARDAARQPVEVLSFLGLEEGMTAMDIMASGGWYTEVLSHAVGPEGTVLMQNSPRSLGMRNTEAAVQARLADNRLPNVQRVNADMSDLGIEPGTVDFALTALNFHDLYNSDPEAAQAMLLAVKETLKPGGILGIIDHRGNDGADNAALHRITQEEIEQALFDAGYESVAASDLLAAEDDPRTSGPFDPSLGRNTDRILLRAYNPEML
ncbi:MAG: SAM-dependent methyltransferase [Gammaproteobacteria bacterium]|nr:SAM-dependent methyltransferase [Gammaproteobacteria bacterium]|tara:strand:- start:3150 stop:3890 length:741 start_codon:yes stop_codon:yes gene_type:complete